jgi:hypothetical protein
MDIPVQYRWKNVKIQTVSYETDLSSPENWHHTRLINEESGLQPVITNPETEDWANGPVKWVACPGFGKKGQERARR